MPCDGAVLLQQNCFYIRIIIKNGGVCTEHRSVKSSPVKCLLFWQNEINLCSKTFSDASAKKFSNIKATTKT